MVAAHKTLPVPNAEAFVCKVAKANTIIVVFTIQYIDYYELSRNNFIIISSAFYILQPCLHGNHVLPWKPHLHMVTMCCHGTLVWE